MKFGDKIATQAWTQGEPTESKYWFPCVDNPQLKYPRQVSIVIPAEFIAISNGELNLIDQYNEGKLKKYVWEANLCVVATNFDPVLDTYQRNHLKAFLWIHLELKWVEIRH